MRWLRRLRLRMSEHQRASTADSPFDDDALAQWVRDRQADVEARIAALEYERQVALVRTPEARTPRRRGEA